MMADALQAAIAQDDTTTDDPTSTALDVDVSGDLFDAFDARADDLAWLEADDGALLAADSTRAPETVARVTLDGEGLAIELVDPREVDLRRARTLSRAESAPSPQFD